jgi:two-component system response regulator ChvI
MSIKIAIVDNDRNILTSLSMALMDEHFVVRTYPNGFMALQGIENEPVDLALVDIKMPQMDGFELLKRLRRGTDIPVILLTAKTDEADEVLGLRLGADDYIRKPYSLTVLLARIQRALNRTSDKTRNAVRNELKQGDLSLSLDKHLCTWKGRPVDLTVTEIKILRTLACWRGQVKSRDQLINAAYGEAMDLYDRCVDSHVKRLRTKFRKVDPQFGAIRTVYGFGYQFDNGGATIHR